MTSDQSDCIIIGGGPAGLSAALMLARYLRRAVLFHHSSPRNMYAHGIHGFLGHDGIQPAELLARGQSEVRRYGGTLVEACVDSVARTNDGFRITAGTEFRSRTLLIATGLRDVTPDCPGFLDFYGWSIHHCPDCDGYEIRGKRVALITTAAKAVGTILALRTWTANLTLLTNGSTDQLSVQDSAQLREWNVPVVPERVVSVHGDVSSRQIQCVQLESGTTMAVDALFFNLGTIPASSFHESLGCRMEQDSSLIWVDQQQQTSVSGVYAAGDVTPGSQLAVVAAAQGTMAAIHIHKSLARLEVTGE